jgi:hypothetical protein
MADKKQYTVTAHRALLVEGEIVETGKVVELDEFEALSLVGTGPLTPVGKLKAAEEKVKEVAAEVVAAVGEAVGEAKFGE